MILSYAGLPSLWQLCLSECIAWIGTAAMSLPTAAAPSATAPLKGAVALLGGAVTGTLDWHHLAGVLHKVTSFTTLGSLFTFTFFTYVVDCSLLWHASNILSPFLLSLAYFPWLILKT